MPKYINAQLAQPLPAINHTQVAKLTVLHAQMKDAHRL